MDGFAMSSHPSEGAEPPPQPAGAWQAGLWSVGRWRGAARHLVKQTLRLEADISDVESVAEEQSKTLAETAFLFSSLGVNSVGLILIDFNSQIGLYGAGLSLTIAGLYVTWVVLALPRHRINRQPWFMRASLTILVTQGVLWGFLINQLAFVATQSQRNLVTAVIMGLASVPMLGAPFRAAMAFWVPTVIATGIAVAFTLQPFDLYLLLCFGGYVLFTFGGIVVINRTLLERSIGRVRLQQQNETIGLFLRDYEENAADWLWETDARLQLLKMPARLAQLLDSPRRSLEGRRLDVLLGLHETAHPSGRELKAMLNARVAFRDVTVQLELNEQTRWWCLTGRPVLDDRGRFQGYRGIGSDVTDVRLAEQKIRRLATYDSLTGLYNRRMFLDRMNAACGLAPDGLAPDGLASDSLASDGLATDGVTLHNALQGDLTPAATAGDLEGAASGAAFALLLLDLDHFKSVNDDFGHATGDSLLIAASERLRGAVREGDVLARLGGDEFAILLASGETAHAVEVAERLIALLGRPFQFGERSVSIGASAGFAMFPQDGATPKALLRNVDLALYTAKTKGRGNYQRFKAWMSDQYHDKLAMQSDLRGAVEASRLHVDYQPICNLRTGEIVSVEALARWDHPQRGSVPPAEFIRMAEEIGLISRIGEFVLEQACRAASVWPEHVRIAVNLSPMQFGNNTLLRTIQTVLAHSGLSAERLELEVTESTWLAATKQTLDQLDELAKIGVRMVLDDFGTGYSSLACLRTFRFQGLKIDPSFIRDLGRDDKAAAIVKTIVTLASDIGVTLTAEGVETAEQVGLLLGCGIEQAQGFFLGLPRPQAEILAAMRRVDEDFRAAAAATERLRARPEDSAS